MQYGTTVTTGLEFTNAVERTRAALAEQGFGVLTEIDVAATLKRKLDADVEPQIILGACKPSLAYDAMQTEPGIGLLLPCNVVVRRHGGQTLVSALDPQVMVALAANPALQPIADDASARLRAALDTVART